MEKYLGPPKFLPEALLDTSGHPGLVNGLAWTEVGGELLHIETSVLPGKGKLLLTGQLGEVMKESAQAALSYCRSRNKALGVEPEYFDTVDIHIHVPAGAIPKDGPSAGITMTTALVSLFTGRPVKPSVAMTGEVTLQGRVLQIGGVKQKLLAAHRLGLTEVIIPARNEPDLDDVPEAVRDDLTIHLASDVADVIAPDDPGHGPVVERQHVAGRCAQLERRGERVEAGQRVAQVLVAVHPEPGPVPVDEAAVHGRDDERLAHPVEDGEEAASRDVGQPVVVRGFAARHLHPPLCGVHCNGGAPSDAETSSARRSPFIPPGVRCQAVLRWCST